MNPWYRRIVPPRLTRLGIGFLLILSGVIPSSGIVAAAPPAPVTLPGHVLKNLSAMTRLSAVSPDQALTLTIALRPSAPAALRDAAVHAQAAQRGASPWLTPGDVGRLYGQPQATIDALAAYFTSHGLTASPPSPNHLSFQVHGTAAQIEQALSVSLNNYQDSKGHKFYATNKDPQLPGNLAASVQAILGLDNYQAFRPIRNSAAGGPGSYTPSDMQTAYGVTSLYEQGFTGAGQTIGILGCDVFQTTDIHTFESLYGMPQATITTVNVDGGASGEDPEATLDLEWSGAIATGAKLRYYGFPAGPNGGCSVPGFYDAVGTATADPAASVISISLGACEDGLGGSAIQAFETQFAIAASEGKSVMVSSGDSGGFACGGSVPSVAYPGSSGYVVAVGGTALQINQDSSYGSETTWGNWSNCESAPACGTGGGVSAFVQKPSWQANVNSTSWREVPDVALNSDPDTGNVVFFNGLLLNGFGGTSIAAPQWAGMVAIANQAAGHSLGLLNPLLYGSVASAQSSASPPYHDVIIGNNGAYSAGTGWDMTTGWGSPNACNLMGALVSSSKTSASTEGSLGATGLYTVFLPFVVNASSECVR